MSNSMYEVHYCKLLGDAIHNGVPRADRTGVGSFSLFNQSIKFDMSQGEFPLITGRKMFERTFKTEFEWFINGETNIERFRKAGVKIWDAWANEDGELGPVYGHQMLNFNGQGINQLEAVIQSLIHFRDSRRHIISLWNPAQLNEMALPPCYLYFQFFVDKSEKLNMFVVQRSGDLFLGIPYDMALFAQILLYVAEKTWHLPGMIELQIVDAHVYKNQMNAISEYSSQDWYDLPKFTYLDGQLNIYDYKHGPVITAKVAV